MLNVQTNKTLEGYLDHQFLDSFAAPAKEEPVAQKNNKNLTLEDVSQVLKVKADAIELFQQKKYLEALSKFEVTHQKIHSDLEVSLYQALCLFHLDKLEDSKQILEQLHAVDIKHKYYQIPKVLSIILLKQKFYKEAEKLLGQALMVFKNDVQLLNMLAYSLERQNRIMEAESILEKLLLREPEDTNASNSLAYVYYRSEKKTDRSFELVRFALSREPENPAYLDTYALLLLKKNKREEAKVILQKAIKNTPANNTDIFNHIQKMLSTNFDFE